MLVLKWKFSTTTGSVKLMSICLYLLFISQVFQPAIRIVPWKYWCRRTSGCAPPSATTSTTARETLVLLPCAQRASVPPLRTHTGLEPAFRLLLTTLPSV